MGKYYALAQGEDASVAAASEDHYIARANDRVPTDPVSIAVALADKIQILPILGDSRNADGSKTFALRKSRG